MGFLLQGLLDAFRLIISFDTDVLSAVSVTLQVSAAALLISLLLGLPIGTAIGLCKFRGRRVLITVFNTMVGLPTVVVGLLGFAIYSRQGLLGGLDLLFTKTAIITGEIMLAFPIIVVGTVAAIRQQDRKIIDTALTLGADGRQLGLILLSESRYSIIASVVLAFGRCISEVGAAMILGGNIRGSTRTMTTTIALETSKGEFATGIALGLLLLTMAFAVNILLARLVGDRIKIRVIK